MANQQFNPFTEEEFQERVEKSMEDYRKGRYFEASDLLEEIQKWS